MSIPSHATSPTETITRQAAAIELLTEHARRQKQMTTARIALVQAARNTGLNWTIIGDALGLSRDRARVQHLKAVAETGHPHP